MNKICIVIEWRKQAPITHAVVGDWHCQHNSMISQELWSTSHTVKVSGITDRATPLPLALCRMEIHKPRIIWQHGLKLTRQTVPSNHTRLGGVIPLTLHRRLKKIEKDSALCRNRWQKKVFFSDRTIRRQNKLLGSATWDGKGLSTRKWQDKGERLQKADGILE